MEEYKIVTTISDHGPYVSKLILDVPCEVRENEITKDMFHVYVERKDDITNEIIWKEEMPSKGCQKVMDAYPSNENGKKAREGKFITLELSEEPLGKRIDGDILASKYIKNDYRVTLLEEIKREIPISGLVFDVCTGELFPQLEGWSQEKYSDENDKLNYGYFQPEVEKEEQVPLIVWLHGAGEGGTNPKIAYTGNKVVGLSEAKIQNKVGGKAFVLVPQCPTVWMDDGVEQLGRSNQSIYVEPLKKCIDAFVVDHEKQIDPKRIYIGGLSNGGFMTIRMLIDYPDFFAGAIPACECFYKENITKEVIDKLKDIPIWFAHAKTDGLVPPKETSIPLYYELDKAGAKNIHFTCFERMEDLTGRYKDSQGQPMEYFGHVVWIHVYNDHCHTELDGRFVLENGVPVTIWEWLGLQKRGRV